MQFFYRFLKDDSAATSVEYAVIGTILAAAIVVGARSIGADLSAIFFNVGGKFGE